jgi:hypothetical protein
MMREIQRLFALISIFVILATLSVAQDPTRQDKKKTVAPATTSNPVTGSGSAGQMTKWLGVDGASAYTIGDSNVTEDKFGKVGIGTRTPTSLFTVRGMIETTLGGIKFPDGTTQTTAGVSSVFHDASLQGAGTASSPLGVAVPLNLSGSSAPPILNVVNGSGDGLRGASTDNAGVRGDSGTSVGVRGDSVSGIGVLGNGLGSGNGVVGNSVGGSGVSGAGITGVDGKGNDNTNSSGNGGDGVSGEGGSSNGSRGGSGVFAKGGTSNSGPGGFGVFAKGGDSAADDGGVGLSVQGGASSGSTKFGGDAIFAFRGAALNGGTSGFAGSFIGNVDVQGKLTKTMGTFKIDHPLDPENKYLYHSFVESPDMMNIYNGNITTDANGEAVVEMPDYFDALNKDFRYQLTVIGTFAQAIVASKMNGNRFVIRTSAPNVEVSWMVTGVRQDAFANKNRVQVEVDKSEKERGHYLHPEVFNQPEEKSIEWARHPEIMQRLKQQRLEAEEKFKKQQ